MKLSATIVTLNEERNLARAIESLRCCDEVLVVDSGSTDNTRAIAAKFGARVIEHPWPGYAQQKNFAAANAEHDWVLSIDADEAISEVLEAEIWELRKNGANFDAYSMPRLAYYCGRWIRHSGWYPDRKVRVYRRDRARWTGDYIHESVHVDGSVGHLNGNILHFTCSSLPEHRKTLERYTTLAAQQMTAHRKRFHPGRALLDPPWTFLRSYVLHQGFLDGVQGFDIARMAALYTYRKYTKAAKLMRAGEIGGR